MTIEKIKTRARLDAESVCGNEMLDIYCVYDLIDEAYQLGKEEREKYRWHDLRKNPDDLPEIDTVCIIARKYKGDIWNEYCPYEFHEGYGCAFTGVPFREVIAWKKIEPFAEESE